MKELSKEFYINKFEYINSKDFDASVIPMMVRRKLSVTDKVAMITLSRIFDKKVQELIFSSQYGEFDKLNSIISGYLVENEVSPMQFSSSVHNYFAGAFSILNKFNHSYNAISSGENSLSAGLLASIVSEKKDVLFCYADCKPDVKGVSCLISDYGVSGQKFSFTEKKQECSDEFESFIGLLEGKSEAFATSFGTFKRV